jgi:hypothetical protein
MRYAARFFLSLSVVLAAPHLMAQSLELWDTRPDDIHVEIRCVDRTKAMAFSVDTAAGVAGVGTKRFSSHTPDQAKEYGFMGDTAHFDSTEDNKLIRDPSVIVIRLKHSEGARYKITFNGLRECPNCNKRDQTKDKSFETEMLAKKQLVNITFQETGRDPRSKKGWVIDNRSGILKWDSGYWIDPGMAGRSFNITCVNLDMSLIDDSVRHKVSPMSKFQELGAYRDFAESAYGSEAGSEIAVEGNLHHSGGHMGGGKNASFEGQPSDKHSDYLLISGDGGQDTHKNYRYTFDVVDVAEGHSESLSEALLAGLAAPFPPLRQPLPSKAHPAGAIPPGFRAITCRCKCCPSDPKYVIAFAGTTAWSLSDWISNISQGLPIVVPIGSMQSYESRVAPHYEFAVQYASWVIKQNKLGYGGGLMGATSVNNLTVAGHSLGGGLSSYVSGYYSVPGFGYNPAPLASAAQVLMRGERRPDMYFTNVRTPLDPVSGLLPVLPFQSSLVGQVFTVESVGDWGSSFTVNDHMIGSIGERVIGYRAPMPLGK